MTDRFQIRRRFQQRVNAFAAGFISASALAQALDGRWYWAGILLILALSNFWLAFLVKYDDP